MHESHLYAPHPGIAALGEAAVVKLYAALLHSRLLVPQVRGQVDWTSGRA